MKRRTLLAGGVAAAALAAPAVRAQSPDRDQGALLRRRICSRRLHEQIAAEFMKANPQYKVTFLAPQPAYEEVAQATLRAAVTNTLPDVAYHGLNRQRVFFDRGLAQPLDPLIAADPDFKTYGPLARPARCRPLRRQAARHRLLGVDADHLLQRRPRDQGRRQPRRASGRLGRHLRAGPQDQGAGRLDARASTSTGTSPATGCGRRWSSPTAAPC